MLSRMSVLQLKPYHVTLLLKTHQWVATLHLGKNTDFYKAMINMSPHLLAHLFSQHSTPSSLAPAISTFFQFFGYIKFSLISET